MGDAKCYIFIRVSLHVEMCRISAGDDRKTGLILFLSLLSISSLLVILLKKIKTKDLIPVVFKITNMVVSVSQQSINN